MKGTRRVAETIREIEGFEVRFLSPDGTNIGGRRVTGR